MSHMLCMLCMLSIGETRQCQLGIRVERNIWMQVSQSKLQCLCNVKAWNEDIYRPLQKTYSKKITQQIKIFYALAYFVLSNVQTYLSCKSRYCELSIHQQMWKRPPFEPKDVLTFADAKRKFKTLNLQFCSLEVGAAVKCFYSRLGHSALEPSGGPTLIDDRECKMCESWFLLNVFGLWFLKVELALRLSYIQELFLWKNFNLISQRGKRIQDLTAFKASFWVSSGRMSSK